MAELFELVVSWPTLIMVLLVFGFLPGTVLRLAVHLYPKGDPRRTELVNDLAVIKYSEKPLWVVSQLETALHEGIAERWAAGHKGDPAFAVRAVALGSLWLSFVGSVSVAVLFGFDLAPPWVSGIVALVSAVSGAAGVYLYVLHREGTRAIAQEPEVEALGERLAAIEAEIRELNDSIKDRRSAAMAFIRHEELTIRLDEEKAHTKRLRLSRWSRLILR